MRTGGGEDVPVACPSCGGSGRTEVPVHLGEDVGACTFACRTCAGTGIFDVGDVLVREAEFDSAGRMMVLAARAEVARGGMLSRETAAALAPLARERHPTVDVVVAPAGVDARLENGLLTLTRRTS